MSADAPRQLTFVWWNVHDFAAFDPARSSSHRWPPCEEHFVEKQRRIITAISQLDGGRIPDLIALCEVTREAAESLATKLPDHELTFAPPVPKDDPFQVVVYFRKNAGFSVPQPILCAHENGLTRETRPMIPVHFAFEGHLIRFIACHWTAFDTQGSDVARQRLADILRANIYDFFNREIPISGQARHVVVLGDLNIEPTDPILETRLLGRRDRRSADSNHWREDDVARVRLYNLSWRHFGEQIAHHPSVTDALHVAGTCYGGKRREWRTFDQLMVSSGLLNATLPMIDERQTCIVNSPLHFGEDSLPVPFEMNKAGISDHLPILGKISLPEDTP